MNKRELLRKLVKVPENVHRSFWAKEFRILNSLLKKFPDIKFWEKLDVEKVSSLTLYAGEDVFSIEERYKKYSFKPPITNDDFTLGEKSGKDYKNPNKKKTLKQFLNEKGTYKNGKKDK